MTTFTDAELDTITDVLKALAHDVRLKLMRTLLENGEKTVGELETMTGIGQPGLSQQLAILRKADLVQTRRDAKLVFYSLSPEALQGAAKLLCALSGISPKDAQPGTKSGNLSRGVRRPLSQGYCEPRFVDWQSAPDQPRFRRNAQTNLRHSPCADQNRADSSSAIRPLPASASNALR